MAREQQKRHSVPTIVIMLFRSEKKNVSQSEHNLENLDFFPPEATTVGRDTTRFSKTEFTAIRWYENVHLLVQMRFVLMTSYISIVLLLLSVRRLMLASIYNGTWIRIHRGDYLRMFSQENLPRDPEDAAVQAFSPFPCFLKTKFISRLNKRLKKFFNFTELQPFNCVSSAEDLPKRINWKFQVLRPKGFLNLNEK